MVEKKKNVAAGAKKFPEGGSLPGMELWNGTVKPSA